MRAIHERACAATSTLREAGDPYTMNGTTTYLAQTVLLSLCCRSWNNSVYLQQTTGETCNEPYSRGCRHVWQALKVRVPSDISKVQAASKSIGRRWRGSESTENRQTLGSWVVYVLALATSSFYLFVAPFLPFPSGPKPLSPLRFCLICLSICLWPFFLRNARPARQSALFALFYTAASWLYLYIYRYFYFCFCFVLPPSRTALHPWSQECSAGLGLRGCLVGVNSTRNPRAL